DFLGYEAADRKPEEVDLRGVQGGDERDGVPCHLQDRGGRCSGRTPDTYVVERDDAPLRRQRIDELEVPVLQVAPEVLQQHQRNRDGADFTVGVVDTVAGTDDLVGSRAIAESRCCGHVAFLSSSGNEGNGPGCSQATLSWQLTAVIHLFR